MSERPNSRPLASDNILRIIVAAALLIIASIIVFETRPSPNEGIGMVCNNCSYDVNEKPSYRDKLLDPISLFTLALVISTVFLWRATERLALLAESQGSDTRNAALAARKSAEVAESALKDIERAAVFCNGNNAIVAPELPITQQSVYVVGFEWKNSGKTWTKTGFSHISWATLTGPVTRDFDFPDYGEPPKEIFIPPQASINGGPLIIPAANMIDAFEGRNFLYVWGWVEYDDVFPGTPRHRSEFCYRIHSVTQPSDTPQGLRKTTVAFSNADIHNGADDNCLRPLKTGSARNPFPTS